VSERTIPVRRATIDRLRDLWKQRDLLDAEAIGILQGIAGAFDLDVARIIGIEDGAEPGVIYRDDDSEQA
jgi:hypothetical protein